MRKKGFTLVELLVVISIIAILMAISLIGTSVVTKRSRDAKRKSDLAKVQGALTMYYSDKRTYPLPCGNAFPCYWDGTLGGYSKLVDGYGNPATDSTAVKGLVKDGYLEAAIQDMIIGDEADYAYRYRPSEDGLNFELSAKLENTGDDDLMKDFTGDGTVNPADGHDPDRFERGTDKTIRTDGSGNGSVSLYPNPSPENVTATPARVMGEWVFGFEAAKRCDGCQME